VATQQTLYSSTYTERLPYGEQMVPDDDRMGWPELFLAIQVLWGAVLFVPGAQSMRFYVRALPYVISGAALIYYFRRATAERLPESTKWLVCCALLLLLNLLHQTTHLMAGIGQIVFQASIAAPVFWMARAVRSQRRLERLVWVLFAASLLASSVGVLQVYYPERFLPREFSALAQSLNPEAISSLTYVGVDGRQIIRPPGLSDMPGGAAIAGMFAMILGLTLAVQPHQKWPVRLICLAAGAIGMTTLLLTQVRSLSLLAAASVGVSALMRFRRGRAYESVISMVAGVALLAAAYLWAVSVGGESVSDRFTGLMQNTFRTFDESRGLFLRYTMTETLYEFPFGAGLGRWGMMQVLFGDSTLWQAPPIHVEIQPTGWLLDGGVPLMLLYSGALAAAVLRSYKLVVHLFDNRFQDCVTTLLCMQVAILGLCLTGPVFNTQLGIQFWAVTGALFGAVTGQRERAEADGEEAVDA
jgi:hypothetical protein